MITNPSCPSDNSKDSDPKFHSSQFDDDLSPEMSSGAVPGGGGDLYHGQFVSGQHGHGGYPGQHYNGWYGQTADYYYTGGGGGQGAVSGSGYYHSAPAGHYTHAPAPGQLQYHQDQWPNGGSHQGMVLPPGPSPTGSNNSPSPHGGSYSDNNDNTEHRPDLKRPSPDTFVPAHTSLAPASINHHQATVAKKPKPSKRRKKRDPNEPQKPVSAYALFFRDTQASIKLRNPNANFGEVSKIVAATWDALDPDSKAAYKKRTEMAKKEYLRALAAYRANLVSKGSGHDLYGGFPGYGPMLFSNGSPMEQAMPATGLGLGPGNISPGSIGPGPNMVQGLPPHYNGSYHPPYMQQQNIQLQHGSHGGQHLQQPQHSPGPNSSPKIKLEDGGHDSYENGHFRAPGQYPPHSGAGQYPGQYQAQPQPPQQGQQGQQAGSSGEAGQYSNKCGRLGCRNYTPGHSDYCSSECVMGKCEEVYDSWSSCMVKTGPNPGHTGPNPDVMVK